MASSRCRGEEKPSEQFKEGRREEEEEVEERRGALVI